MDYVKLMIVAALLSLGVAVPASADIAVIVNPANESAIDQAGVRKIFLGKTKTFPNGQAANVYDLTDDDNKKAEFSEKVLRKSLASLNSYWSRMIFSSKGKPPTAVTAEKAKEAVANNTDAIAYIDSKDVDSSVKVLFVIK